MKELNQYPNLRQTRFTNNDSTNDFDESDNTDYDFFEYRDGLHESSSEEYLTIKNDITKWMESEYNMLERSSSKQNSSTGVCSEPIQISTQEAMLLDLPMQESLCDVQKMASAPFTLRNLEDSLPKHVYYFGPRNIHILFMPLKRIINRNDRSKIIPQANYNTHSSKSEPDCHIHLCFISRTDLDNNKGIAGCIYQFLTHVFKDEESHVTELLKSDQTRVLAIVNMKNNDSQNISTKSFLAAVMYATNRKDATVFDFIAVSNNLRFNGYGSFLMHFAQIFAKIECKNQDNSSDSDPFWVYLCCRQNLTSLYMNNKFNVAKPATMNKQLKNRSFYNRMNMAVLKKKGLKLDVMSTKETIPRVVNKLNPPFNVVETSLYSAISSTSVISKVECPPAFVKHINLMLETYEDKTSYRRITKNDINSYVSEDNMFSYLGKLYKKESFVPLGDLFVQSIEDWRLFLGGEIPKTFSTSIKPIVKPCMIQMICNNGNANDLDNTSFWINMKCALCQKKVYVKKEASMTFVRFMLKAIYSIWFTHIFGFENITNSQWHTKNSHWNVCVRRTGIYFSMLKDAIRFDEDYTTNTTVLYKAQLMSKCLLEKFIEKFQEQFIPIHQSKLKFMTALQCEIVQKQQKTTTTTKPNAAQTNNSGNEDTTLMNKDTSPNGTSLRKRPKRKCTAETYTERQHKTLQDIGACVTNRNKKITLRKGNKKERHIAEQEYNELVHRDYEQQRKFQMIEYVDISKRSQYKELSSASKDYLSTLPKDRNNNIKHKDKHEENHWLMYPRGQGATPVVVAEEWFIVTNDHNVEIDRRISEAVVKKCKRNCNNKFNLGSSDINKINKFVDENTKNIQILRIEKLKKEEKPNDDIVTIRYKSFRALTKIEYKGYDLRKCSHLLTSDWVELNFKDSHETFWNEVINLKPGEGIDVPSTSRMVMEHELTKEVIEHAPLNFFTQAKGDNSCLFSSLASAFHTLEYYADAFALMYIYEQYIKKESTSNLNMNQIIDIIMHNKFLKQCKRKFRFKVQKLRTCTYEMMLEKRNDNVMYHCILSNLHAVVFVNEWIIDPAVSLAMTKTIDNFKLCAQLEETESPKDSIILCYYYIAHPKKSCPTETLVENSYKYNR